MNVRVFITQDGEEARETLFMCCSVGYVQAMDVIRHNCTDSFSRQDIEENFETQEFDENGYEICATSKDNYILLIKKEPPEVILAEVIPTFEDLI